MHFVEQIQHSLLEIGLFVPQAVKLFDQVQVSEGSGRRHCTFSEYFLSPPAHDLALRDRVSLLVVSSFSDLLSKADLASVLRQIYSLQVALSR